MKSVEAGLCSMWASGFMLLLLSFYATNKLPSLGPPSKVFNRRALVRPPPPPLAPPPTPKITIFTAPSPFVGPVGDRQSLALRSWLGLSSQVTVVLFARHESVVSFAHALGSRVAVESEVDFTFLGTPFFHSMVARSQKFMSDIAVFVHAETIFLPDFISALNFVHRIDHGWFLFASACNVSHVPFQLDDEGKHWLRFDRKKVKVREVQEMLSQCRRRSHNDERMVIAWNKLDMPLHNGVLPPFLFGKQIHNAWLVNEVISSELRFALDASWSISGLYISNNARSFPNEQMMPPFESKTNERGWERMVNTLLGAAYGSSISREDKNFALLRLLKCNKTFLLVDRNDDVIHVSGTGNMLGFLEKSISQFWGNKNLISCAKDTIALGSAAGWPLKDESVSMHFPFSLKSLLKALADENNTIILGVAGYSYKDMLMSWVCRLRALEVTNFIVCALDPETYEFSLVQGLPVFKDQSAPSEISFDDCHFGTECFQKVTKVKSRMVLQILKLGYNVLMSDVDVYWFRNPLPYLSSFGPAVLVAQSDEFNETGPINMPRRLNSGFYFAHSDASTIAALEKVVKHAAASGLSEQPSFYDMLCGEGGINRLGDNVCLEPETNLTVHFLDRNRFPNGAYGGLWEEREVKESCLKRGCFILHNNWINGRKQKLERQLMTGLWEYDMALRMCWHSWHKVEIMS